MKTEFENSIRRSSFLCHTLDIKTAWRLHDSYDYMIVTTIKYWI